MYIASRAAAASTASEIIVNIIIVTLSLIFKFVNPKNFLSYLARSISLTSVNNLAVSLTYIKNNS